MLLITSIGIFIVLFIFIKQAKCSKMRTELLSQGGDSTGVELLS